jgi:hypothetical protein
MTDIGFAICVSKWSAVDVTDTEHHAHHSHNTCRDRVSSCQSSSARTLCEVPTQVVLAVDALCVGGVGGAAQHASDPDLPPLLLSPSAAAGDCSHYTRSYVGLPEASPAAQTPPPPPRPPPPLHPEGPPFLDMRMHMSPARLTQVPSRFSTPDSRAQLWSSSEPAFAACDACV